MVMAMDRSLIDWDENDVQNWLVYLGYPQYEANIKEHRISGDVLSLLDQETLKDVGVSSIGQRLAILKAVYMLKIAQNIPIEADHWIPPSEAQERSQELTVEKLHSMLSDQAQRLRIVEEENKILNTTLQSFLDDYNALRSSLTRPNSNSEDNSTTPPLRRQPSFKWAQYVKPTKSPTKADLEANSVSNPSSTSSFSPHPSPGAAQLEHDIPPYTAKTPRQAHPPPPPNPNIASSSTSNHASTSTSSPDPSTAPSTSSPTPTPTAPKRQDSNPSTDTLKSFKVSLEDPTYKVLPAALKKYRIQNDNWENYAMFICYGSPSNRIERCLSYDEKPLLLFQKLKDAKKNPVFMLKHIKDIRSPIVVAQQKHAARKAGSIASAGDQPPSSASAAASASNTANANTTNNTTNNPSGLGHRSTPSRTITRPPKLEVHDLSARNVPHGLNSGVPEAPGVGSPLGEQPPSGTGTGLLTPHTAANSTSSANTTPHSSPNPNSYTVTAPTPTTSASTTSVSAPTTNTRELPPPTTTPGAVSYAVAIYPYMAEQADEFDVVVGDTFIILSRARGWWVVQRDPEGTGQLETISEGENGKEGEDSAEGEGEAGSGATKQGWVPAGCLLETLKPVAVAIREAREARGDSTDGASNGHVEAETEGDSSKTPILPLSIISTSFPGIALMDYKKKGEEELDLAKDDALRVFKRYNHWSYAVKESTGDRGWVPSWFIGKITTSPNTNTTAPLNTSSSNNSSNNSPHAQVQTPPTPHLDSDSAGAGGGGSGGMGVGGAQVSPMSSAFPSTVGNGAGR